MNIYERAGSLKLRVEASQIDDQHLELQQQASELLSQLRDRVVFLEMFAMLSDVLGLDERPKLDKARLHQAVDGFRSALTQHNAAAVQQQPAVTLLSSAQKIEESLARWALSAWKAEFEDLSALIGEDGLQGLAGPPVKVARARRIASQIQTAIGRNPMRDLGSIQTGLEADGLEACVVRIRELGGELRSVLEELKRAQAELPPQVQMVLERTASKDGFPLEDLTEEMLTSLREAGVLGEFVVRRY
ncbi:hypothetical protein [Candidatus Poriferisodalis sp.]|uniref:hypothetical protein n=1 Tax=Candidatus Poriferisodalis sp. TaxID=3101277 RepID=UPI003B527BAC